MYTVEEKLKEMQQVLRRKKMQPIFFVGSGLSRRYLDSPDWESLLKEIAKEAKCNYEDIKKQCGGEYEKIAQELEYYCFRNADSDDLKNSNRRTILRNLIAKVFVQCVDKFNETEILKSNKSYNKDISEHLEMIDCIDDFEILDNVQKCENEYTQMKEKLATCSENIRKIIEINELRKINPKAIITTNYDTLIEDIIFENRCKRHIGQEGILSEYNNLEKIDLYKIHGCVTKSESIIITKEDYDTFMAKSKYLYSKIFTLFCECPIIFVGYSVSDRNIKDILTVMIDIMTDEEKEEFLKQIWVVDFVKHEEDEGVIAKEIDLLNGNSISITCFCLKYYDKLYKAINEIVLRPQFENLKFTIANQVIDLLIEPLYEQQNRLKVVTRELLQNALDACKKKAVHAKIAIRIVEEGENKYLEIEDNGIGMNLQNLKENFLTVGKTNKKGNCEGLVGKYGIGVLSIFLIGDYAEVYTKQHNCSILSLKIYIKDSQKQVSWLDNSLSYQSINKDSFTIVKIRVNEEIGKKFDENVENYLNIFGLDTYISKQENEITLEIKGKKVEIPKVIKREWFSELGEGIKLYRSKWFDIDEVKENERSLKSILDQDGYIFYNDMTSPVEYDKLNYRQLNDIKIPFVMIDIKNTDDYETDIKTNLSRNKIQISGNIMKRIAREIYKLEIETFMEVLSNVKERTKNNEVEFWDILKQIENNCPILGNNTDIFLYDGKLFFSKEMYWEHIEVYGNNFTAKQIFGGFQKPTLYHSLNVNRKFVSDCVSRAGLVCISVKYLDDYIYYASSPQNGLRKEALVKILNHLEIYDITMNCESTMIWQYINADKQKIQDAYNEKAQNKILYFKDSSIINIKEDVNYIIAFETSYIHKYLDDDFYEILQENINKNTYNNIVNVYRKKG